MSLYSIKNVVVTEPTEIAVNVDVGSFRMSEQQIAQGSYTWTPLLSVEGVDSPYILYVNTFWMT